jgi:hypothetical protein
MAAREPTAKARHHSLHDHLLLTTRDAQATPSSVAKEVVATIGETVFWRRRPSAIVKGFGCRPFTEGATRTGAGVRKPPREETAIGPPQ